MQPIQPRASVTTFVLLSFTVKWRISKFGIGVGNLGDCFLQVVCLREVWWQALWAGLRGASSRLCTASPELSRQPE